jgi:hypothetical protein
MFIIEKLLLKTITYILLYIHYCFHLPLPSTSLYSEMIFKNSRKKQTCFTRVFSFNEVKRIAASKNHFII